MHTIKVGWDRMQKMFKVERYAQQQKMNYKGRAYKSGTGQAMWDGVVRKAVLKRYDNRCADCMKKHKRLHLHHESYENQTIHTIKPVCPKCHRNRHKKDNT